MVVPRSEPLPSGRLSSVTGHDSGRGTAVFRAANREEIVRLASLRDLVSSGEPRLDPVLAAIADAAKRLTGASAAAIAMKKDGLMVCRARSGDPAPPLGMELNAQAGISGECLRTGVLQNCSDTENSSLVDVEVCRSLKLRSIAVLPIRGRSGVKGILEVFSTRPSAFTEHQLSLLEELTRLAEEARTLRQEGAPGWDPWREQDAEIQSSKSQSSGILTSQVRSSGLFPASDAVGDVALAMVGGQSRRIVLGIIAVVAIVLVGLAMWLGWRGEDQNESRVHPLPGSSVSGTGTVDPSQARLPDNDPVWKPNPGGETLYSSKGKPSAGSPVKFASEIELIAGNAPPKRTPLRANADDPNQPHGSPTSGSLPLQENLSAKQLVADPPSISSDAGGSSGLNGAFSAESIVPAISDSALQGISGGRLLHRVSPIYPAQAQNLRLEGRVVLSATVSENGSISDMKVVEGAPVLVQSAVEAVKHWRYQPFLLDGKPIPRQMTITVDFKLPSDTPSIPR